MYKKLRWPRRVTDGRLPIPFNWFSILHEYRLHPGSSDIIHRNTSNTILAWSLLVPDHRCLAPKSTVVKRLHNYAGLKNI